MRRTDLALEARETNPNITEGIDYDETIIDDIKITHMRVNSRSAAKKLGKPIGNYITVEVPKFTDNNENIEEHAGIISKEIKALLPNKGLVFVAGLGNKDITPDNLGPLTLSHILATRHITGELANSSELLSSLRSVAAISPGVLGQTGIETGEILYSISKRLKPTAIIAIDALASLRLERLGCTIQISDTGISPGSGVGNARPQINEETIGVPVIAIGIPTVVDALTLASDLLENENILPNQVSEKASVMMVTPREIDLLIKRSAKVVALAVNMALQENLSANDILALVS